MVVIAKLDRLSKICLFSLNPLSQSALPWGSGSIARTSTDRRGYLAESVASSEAQ